MIMMAVFLSIFNHMEIHLTQNWKENCLHDHIPFNLKGNGILVFSVQWNRNPSRTATYYWGVENFLWYCLHRKELVNNAGVIISGVNGSRVNTNYLYRLVIYLYLILYNLCQYRINQNKSIIDLITAVWMEAK